MVGWGGLWTASKVEVLAYVSRLPRFILLVSFSDTLLVVSILDIACPSKHTTSIQRRVSTGMIAICGRFYGPEGDY